MLLWDNGMFQVGPESAGAHPGPASYRKGGPLTVTDANLFLGRLLPEYFPKIFGKHEDMPLDIDVVTQKFIELTKAINQDSGRAMTPQEVAHGFIDVANESMSRPIRALTEARGFETSQHNLATFGGAGGQHACEIAEKLGIQRIVIHKYSSILSAYGMALAEVVAEAQEPSTTTLTPTTLPELRARIDSLKDQVKASLLEQGVDLDAITYEPHLNLRYERTETNFMIREPADKDYKSALHAEHLRELSFSFSDDKKIIVDDIRVRGVGTSSDVSEDNTLLREEISVPETAETNAAAKAETVGKRGPPFVNSDLTSTRSRPILPAMVRCLRTYSSSTECRRGLQSKAPQLLSTKRRPLLLYPVLQLAFSLRTL